MDIDELADNAVAALVERLSAQVTDSVSTLITDRLSATKTGSRALQALSTDSGQELASSVLADELARDPGFAPALASALASAPASALGRPATQTSSVTIGGRARIKGDVAGGNIDKSKRFHIGSIRFGGGGLSALIVAGLLGGGGAGYGIYNVVTVSPGEGYVSESEKRNGFATSASSIDLDDSHRSKKDGDGIADLSFDHTAVIATGGALIARLAPGVVPNPAVCDRALEGASPRVNDAKKADLICVRTSRRALAAVTISEINTVNENNAMKTTFFSLDWAYWAPRG